MPAAIPNAPCDIAGIPAKFGTWRPGQLEAVSAVLDSTERLLVLVQPTGSGKSLCYIAAALLGGKRTCVLTSTKALQDQLVADFSGTGLVCMKGMCEHVCKLNPKVTVEEGVCRSGVVECNIKESCSYFAALIAAQNARLVVTNYAFWASQTKQGANRSLGYFDLLVLDEAHTIPETCVSYQAAELRSSAIRAVLGDELAAPFSSVEDTRVSAPEVEHRAQDIADAAEEALEFLQGQAVSQAPRVPTTLVRSIQTAKLLVTLADTVLRASVNPASWALQVDRDDSDSNKGDWILTASPIRPSRETFLHLFDAEQVLLTSATVNCATMARVGLHEKDYHIKEFPSTFPVANRPFIYIPTAKIVRGVSDEDLRVWVNRIDEIVESRKDRKGILHTGSYDRARYFVAHTRHADMVFHNHRYNLRTVVEAFKDTADPALLVSPAVTTGYDFPGSLCEYQIIGKVPFPGMSGSIMDARLRADTGLLDYITAQALVQAYGRGVRSATDTCDTFIVDNTFEQWFRRNRRYLPVWFVEAVAVSAKVPRASRKIRAPCVA